MTPQQWQKIDELFQAAVKLELSQREAFLDEASGGDSEIRNTVAVMLTSDECEWKLIEQPALQFGASLLIDEEPQLVSDQSVGHYRIVRLIGKGGMGEVYLANDERLNRTVALKLLPAEYTQHNEHFRRFGHEARAASALNHPNILTIHEIGETDGKPFITTEFVEGETLRQRIRQSRLGIIEALDIAIQLATALTTAHKVGIIHRDVKPENIMLRPDGYVKLLDFGLAKLVDDSREVLRTVDPENPDISSGLLMGTVKYMSPEQARHDPVDRRSDIFSLGVVLYEMLSGRTPFEAKTLQEQIKVLIDEDPRGLGEFVGDQVDLERIVNRALKKNRDERYQSAEDLLADLKEVRRQLEHIASSYRVPNGELAEDRKSTSVSVTLGSPLTPKRRGLAITVLSLTLVFAVIGLTLKSFVVRRPITFQNVQPAKLDTIKLTGDAAISPDGKLIAYTDDEGVWLNSRDRTQSAIQIISSSGADISGLVFSNDGKQLYFNRERDVYRIPIARNTPEIKVLSKVDCRVAVSPDDRQLAFIRSNPSEGETLLIVATTDGNDERRIGFRKEPVSFVSINGPAWSPDGTSLIAIVEGGSVNTSALITFDVASGAESKISTPIEWPRFRDVKWLSDRSLVLITTEGGPTSSTQIWQLSYPGWIPSEITSDGKFYESIAVAKATNALLAIERERQSDIWVAPLDDSSDATQITNSQRPGLVGVASMPDGRVVYHSREEGNDGIWQIDADGKNRKSLTPDSDGNFYPSVSNDGRYVVFMSRRTGTLHVWRLDLETKQELQVTAGNDEQFPQVTSDGKEAYYVSWANGIGTVWKVSTKGGSPSQVINENSYYPQLSPDGHRLTYVTFNDTSLVRKVVSVENGTVLHSFKGALARPSLSHWSRAGDALLYSDESSRNVWRQSLSGQPAEQLTHFDDGRIYSFAPSQNGKSLVLSRGTESRSLVLFEARN